MKIFLNGGMEKILALKRMLKDSGKYFPELVPTIQKELQNAEHERDCRLMYGRVKLFQRKILGKDNKVKERIVFVGGEK